LDFNYFTWIFNFIFVKQLCFGMFINFRKGHSFTKSSWVTKGNLRLETYM
jgi:hypothetical protein